MLAVLVLLAGLVATPATAAPAPSPRTPLDQSALLSQVVPGLVDINTTLSYQGAVGAGTGILLNPDGEVLTNNHVIEGATEITAVSLANSRTSAVDVIGFDRASDIALVRLRGAGSLPTAGWAPHRRWPSGTRSPRSATPTDPVRHRVSPRAR